MAKKKKDLVFIPRKEQTPAQKKKNGSNYFDPKYMSSDQKEKYL